MAKIIKMGSHNITPTKVANPFKTSRNSTTNPFLSNKFEGSTLVAADIFEGYKAPETNKLKMIASSVTGSMNKMRSKITEPIVNFVNRVRTGVSNAWDYAKNTNVSDLAGIKALSEVLNKEIEIPGMKAIENHISGIKEGISSHVNLLGNNLTDLGKNISESWNGLISKIGHNHKINSDLAVADLETLWKHEIELSNTEVA